MNETTPKINNELPFYPLAHESAKAFAAFLAWIDVGESRSCSKVAAKTGSSLSTVKSWSRRFDWGGRIAAYNTHLLRARLDHDTRVRKEQAEIWRQRADALKQSEWEAHERLIAAAGKILEKIKTRDP